MDRSSHSGVWIQRVPLWLGGTCLAGILWTPAHIAIHNGQVTPLLCALFALGIHQPPLIRGLCVGLVCAIKPVFLPMAPFVALAFGPWAGLGILLGLLPAFYPLSWFIEYTFYIADFSNRPYSWIAIKQYIGLPGSLLCMGIPSLFLTRKYRNQEKAYLWLITITTIGTAFWFHSYMPLIVPLAYTLGQFLSPAPPNSVDPSC